MMFVSSDSETMHFARGIGGTGARMKVWRSGFFIWRLDFRTNLWRTIYHALYTKYCSWRCLHLYVQLTSAGIRSWRLLFPGPSGQTRRWRESSRGQLEELTSVFFLFGQITPPDIVELPWGYSQLFKPRLETGIVFIAIWYDWGHFFLCHHLIYWFLDKGHDYSLAGKYVFLRFLTYDASVPVVCVDEKPYQLLGEFRTALKMRPGSDKKIDSEYVRNGTCSIFAFTQPLAGVRNVSVREHHTAVDWEKK